MVGHDEKCRLHVIGEASVDLAVAARVKVARDREDEWQAKKTGGEREEAAEARRGKN